MQLKDQEEELDDLAAQVQAQTRYTGTGRAAKVKVDRTGTDSGQIHDTLEQAELQR